MTTALSGINPSSSKGLHLGNYLGAVKRFIAYQDKFDTCYFFVANLHALNTVYSQIDLIHNTQDVFLEYLAFGIDPQKSIFYIESDIPQIPYLQTILNNCVTVSELQRMHGYKDKLQKDQAIETINAGLFEYPVLMAADILLFSPDVVPVGDDQTQHVEICREIAKTFNNRYGNVLTIPELQVEKTTAKILGTDGQRKMSKSLGNDLSIFAPEDVVKKQIMSITTDPARIRPTDPGDPVKNICFAYLSHLDYDQTQLGQMQQRYKEGTIGDVEIKNILLETFLNYFKVARLKKIDLQKNSDLVAKIRQEGAQKATEIAVINLEKIKQAIGL